MTDEINPISDNAISSEDENNNSPTTVDPQAILRILDNLQQEIIALRTLLTGVDQPIPMPSVNRSFNPLPIDQEGARVIEGVFDGQNMVGPDGKQYSVPANYASKSKLVEGDVLKLTITRDGSFIYKQIGPVERQRQIGALIRDEVTAEYKVDIAGRQYKVLLASITYFKGEAGDDAVILIPKEGETRWAAVENIIKKGSLDTPPAL